MSHPILPIQIANIYGSGAQTIKAECSGPAQVLLTGEQIGKQPIHNLVAQALGKLKARHPLP